MKLHSGSRVLQLSSYTFDLSVMETFLALINGGTLCVPSEDTRVNNLGAFIASEGVTFAVMTPSVARIVDTSDISGLESMTLGGEAILQQDVARLIDHVPHLVGGYGPTETSIASATVHFRNKNMPADNLGYALNCINWVVQAQDHSKLSPIGTVGELVIEGAIVGRGYLGDIGKTKSAFTTSPPWLPTLHKRRNERFYYSGDLVRQNLDGSFQYLGRKDDQKKIRGQRIELGEIESAIRKALKTYHGVAVDVVQMKEGRDMLLGFLPLDSTPRSYAARQSYVASLGHALRLHVPRHMIPDGYLFLSRIPLTSSGKCDRRALRILAASSTADDVISGVLYAPFETPTEAREMSLRSLWSQVLDIPESKIGRNSNFFQSGGDSLKAMRLVQRLRTEGMHIMVSQIFISPALRNMALAISQQPPTTHQPAPPQVTSMLDNAAFKTRIAQLCSVSPDSIEDVYPCTPMQEGLVASSNRQPTLYQVLSVLRVKENVEIEQLRAAWNHLYHTDAILRTRIVHTGEGLLQVVMAPSDVPFSYLKHCDIEACLDDQRTASFVYGACLVQLVSLDQDSYGDRYLVFRAHHALCDAWYLQQLFQRVNSILVQGSASKASDFKPFVTFVNRGASSRDEEFWTTELAGSAPPLTPIPKDNSRTAVASAICERKVDIEDHGHSNITRATLLRSAWALLLGQYNATSDVVFGATVSGRESTVLDVECTSGPTIATIPARLQWSRTQTIGSFLEEAQVRFAAALAHTHIGLDIIERLSPWNHDAASLKTLFVVQTYADIQETDDSLKIPMTFVRGENLIPMPLVIEAILRPGSVVLKASFDDSLLHHDQAARLLAQLAHVITQLSKQEPSTLIENAELVFPDDHEMLKSWNAEVLKPIQTCIHSLFERQAQLKPESPAVRSWDGCLSYESLDLLSSCFAMQLRQLGVSTGDLVPFCMRKSLWAVVATMGILKAGAAFVALDPAHPVARMQQILEQTGARLVACGQDTAGKFDDVHVDTVVVDERLWKNTPNTPETLPPFKNPDNLAFVQFTSGSTGQPKGIMMSHRAFASSIRTHAPKLGITNHSNVLQFSAYTYDVSVAEIFTTLAVGGCVCVPSEDERMNNLAATIRRLNVDWAFLTPTMATLLHPRDAPGLKTLVLGGEAASQLNFTTWASHLNLINSYGPAECGVWTNAVTNVKPKASVSDLGRGVGCSLWICDPSDPDVLMPVGATGEILVESPSLALGYWKDKARSAASFILDPAWAKTGTASGRRFYRSGDLAYYQHNGSIVFAGRKDTQIKLHGQRIELGEVETLLAQAVNSSGQCVADIIRPDNGSGSAVLAAFIGIDPDDESLRFVESGALSEDLAMLPLRARHAMSKSLPRYMVPTVFLFMTRIPLNNSGKTDRLQLRKLAASLSTVQLASLNASRATSRSVSSPLEIQLQRIWAEALCLDRESIRADDNLFDLGGNSILAMKISAAARLNGISISFNDVFTYPVLRDLAAVARVDASVEQEPVEPFALLRHISLEQILPQAAADCGIKPDEVQDIYPATIIQSGMFALSLQQQGVYKAQFVFEVPEKLDSDALARAWKFLAAHMNIVKSRMVNYGGTLYQVVTKHVQDCNQITSPLQDYLENDASDAMDLGRPLARCAVVEAPAVAARHLVWTMHHSIYDEAMLPKMLEAFEQAYLREAPPDLPTVQFQAFVKHVGKSDNGNMRSFWATQLSGATSTSFAAPSFSIDKKTLNSNKFMSRTSKTAQVQSPGITSATIIRASWALLLGHYMGTTDVIFGTLSSGRNTDLSGIECVAGPTLTTCPFRCQYSPEDSLFPWLAKLQKQAADIATNEQYGLTNIRDSCPEGGAACDFHTLLNIHSSTLSPFTNSRLGLRHIEKHLPGFDTYPLTLEFYPSSSAYQLEAVYDESAISTQAVGRLLDQLSHVISQVETAGQSPLKVRDVQFASPRDLADISAWNSFTQPIMNVTLHSLFEKAAGQFPNDDALVWTGGRMSYEAVDRQSSRLAQRILQFDLGSAKAVALCFNKSPWAIVAMLAVLKAGATVVPVSPTNPADRQRVILDEVGIKLILCSRELRAACADLNVGGVLTVSTDQDMETYDEGLTLPAVSSTDLALIMFTSGSTGKPKGVVQRHGPLCTSIMAQAKALGATRSSKTLQFAAYSFDASVGDIFCALSTGGSLCIVSEDERVNALAETAATLGATRVSLTPSVARTLSPDDIPTMETMILGGEAASRAEYDIWKHRRVRLLQVYGPTEAAIWCLRSDPTGTPDSNKLEPDNIGRPITPGLCTYWVVDPQNFHKLSALGAPGELLLGGPLLADGYLHDPVKTEAGFVSAPDWVPGGGRLYRTGDLVRLDIDGSVHFIGRQDSQVKLNGLRIELGEIEHQLRQLVPSTCSIAVEILQGQNAPNKTQLAAFISFSGPESTGNTPNVAVQEASAIVDELSLRSEEWKQRLRAVLPEYMIPRLFIPLTKMPLSTAGKLDRKRLKSIGSSLERPQLDSFSGTKGQQKSETTSSEQPIDALSSVWREVLGRENLGSVNDANFFSLGGDSLSAMHLVSAARKHNLKLTVADIFRKPMLLDMAKSVGLCTTPQNDVVAVPRILPFSLVKIGGTTTYQLRKEIATKCGISSGDVEDIFPCTPLQDALMSLSAQDPRSYVTRLTYKLPASLDIDRFCVAWEDVVRQYPSLRTRIVDWPSKLTDDQSSVFAQVIVRTSSEWQFHNAPSINEFLRGNPDRLSLGNALTSHSLVETQGENETYFVWTLHHCVYDGWLLPRIMAALDNAYNGTEIRQVTPFNLFVKYVIQIDQQKAHRFWTEELQGTRATTFPKLPSPQYRPRAVSTLSHSFPLHTTENHVFTLPTILRGAWAVLLGHYNRSCDVVFGVTVHGRNAPVHGVETIGGPTIATVPSRVRFRLDDTIADLLRHVQDRATETIPYEHVGLQNMRKMDEGITSAVDFGTLMAIQTSDRDTASLGMEEVGNEFQHINNCGINLECQIFGENVQIEIWYDEQVIETPSAERLIQQLGHVAAQLCDQSKSRSVGDVDFTPVADLEQLLHWNKVLNAEPAEHCLQQISQAQARRQPDRTCIEAWDGNLTYLEADRLSDSLAFTLRQRGVSSDHMPFVPTLFEKSKWAIVALLAILKAGGTCVPLDPRDPLGRTRSKLDGLAYMVILCSKGTEESCREFGSPYIALSTATLQEQSAVHQGPLPMVPSETGAFLIYTSGSTGTPKGILQTHWNLLHAVRDISSALRMDARTRTLQFSPFTFDVSVADIFMTFLVGGCLCMPTDSDRLDDLAACIRKYRANLVWVTPSVARTLSEKDVPSLRTLGLVGEAPNAGDYERWSSAINIFNTYGVTECAVVQTATSPRSPSSKSSDIGFTMGSTRMWVADLLKPDRLAALGAVGELYMQGKTVSQGYLNDPVRTAQTFLDRLPFTRLDDTIRSGRAFRTGDLVAFDNTGSLQFYGRKDSQIQLRGVRVEVEEIEHVIRSALPNFEVAVDVINATDQLSTESLVAFLTWGNKEIADGAEVTTRELRKVFEAMMVQISFFLPSHMVPTFYIPLESFSATTSGKLDRKGLRNHASNWTHQQLLKKSISRREEIGYSPLTSNEERIADLWVKVLSLKPDRLDASSNWFHFGDSVSAMRLVARARQEGIYLGVQDIFRHPTLRQMASFTSSKDPLDARPDDVVPFSLLQMPVDSAVRAVASQVGVPEHSLVDIYPCTPLQEGFMALSIRQHDAYLQQLVFTVPSHLDIGRFRLAWDLAAENNPILRTRIVPSDTGMLQAIVKAQTQWHESPGLSLQEFLAQDRKNSFKAGGALSRYTVVDDGRHFVWTIHHAVYDGWLLPQILEDVAAAYNSQQLTPRTSFANFVRYTKDIDEDRHRKFWAAHLNGAPAADFPSILNASYQPSTNSYMHREYVVTRKPLSDVTMASMIKGAWCLLLQKYSNSQDVVVGVAANGRSAPIAGIENVNGPTLAAIPFRCQLQDPSSRLFDFLSGVQDISTGMIPFEQTGLQNIRRLCPEYSESCNLKSILVVQGRDFGLFEAPLGLELKAGHEPDTHLQALNLSCVYSEDRIDYIANYDDRCLDSAEIERILRQLHHLITEFCSADPSTTVQDINFLNDTDFTEIQKWNAHMPARIDDCMHRLIEERARAAPNADAICAWDGELTYRELDDVTNKLAHLLHRCGVGPESVVPLLFEKSIFTAVSMLAVQKAGGCCVSLDKSAPDARLGVIIRETKARLALCGDGKEHHLTGKVEEVIVVDSVLLQSLKRCDGPPETGVGPCNAAYMLFTSGSTGVPKGIVITHSSGATSALEHGAVECVVPESRVLQYASYTFDVSISETFTTLIMGGCVCIPSESQRLNDVAGAIKSMRVNHTFLTPTVASLLVPEDVPDLKVLKLGGEALTKENIAIWAGKVKLSNSYGVAECSIRSVFRNDLTPETNFANMGTAVGCAIWITDPVDHSKLCPIGAIGELCIEGPTLARGYFGDEEKTNKSFVQSPRWLQEAYPGRSDRIYKTGDLVRYASDGSLEFVGRSDTQVKLRGQRIDLREIEHFINIMSRVRLSTVLVPRAGPYRGNLVALLSLNKYLEAHQIEDPHSIDRLSFDWKGEISDLIAATDKHLRATLAPYMIPNAWIAVRSIPVNLSGKMDRKRINEWVESLSDTVANELKGYSLNEEDSVSLNKTEEAIQMAFSQALNLPPAAIGLHNSFLYLGGDSISAIRTSSHCRAAGLPVTMQEILLHKTVSQIAAHVASASIETGDSCVIPAENHDTSIALSPIQNMFFDLMPAGNNLYDQGFYLRLREAVDVDRLSRAMHAVADRHSMLRAVFSCSESGHWTQSTRGPGPLYHHFQHHVATSASEALQIIDHTRKQIDIRRGPVFAVASLQLEKEQRLFLTCHHLVVDLVSWRIILHDLENILHRDRLPDPAALAFTQWTEAQIRHHQDLTSPSVAHEALPSHASYWKMENCPNRYGDIRRQSFALERDVTNRLLTPSGETMPIETLDILLGALMSSFTSTFSDREALSPFYESHGRHPWHPSLDIADTVGWFTSLCPVQVEACKNPADSIREVRIARMRTPDHGRSYMASQFHSTHNSNNTRKSHEQMELCFNYIGLYQQFETEESLFSQVNEGEFETDDPTIERFALFDIGVEMVDGRMSVLFTYNRHMAHQDRITAWISAYQSSLISLARAARNLWPNATIGDTLDLDIACEDSAAKLSSTLSMAQKEIAYIGPCTPMQQYLLQYEARRPGFVNSEFLFRIDIPGSGGITDIVRFREAWKQTVRRHSALRTIFVDQSGDSKHWLQVVMNDPPCEILTHTLERDADSQDLASELLDDLPVPYQAGVVHTTLHLYVTSDRLKFAKLDMSHAITDGGSRAVILNDLARAYCIQNSLARVTPFHVSAAMLQQQRSESMQYWSTYLENLISCQFPTWLRPEEPQNRREQVFVKVPGINAFRTIAASKGITLTSLFYALWSILLRNQTMQSSVSFATFSSGRKESIPNIESIVGPFFTVLARSSLVNDEMSVLEIAQHHHDESVKSLPFQDVSMTELYFNGRPAVEFCNTYVNYQKIKSSEAGSTDGLKFETIGFRGQLQVIRLYISSLLVGYVLTLL
jgi:amino acid adenylation domain-containing protein